MTDLELHIAKVRLANAAPDLLAVCEELVESAYYWSEYSVPIGIVDRLNAAIAKAGGTALRTPDRCQWQEDGEAWATQCGEYFQIENGTPGDNRMMFCPYCGRPIDAGNNKETDSWRSRPEGGLKQASGEPLNPEAQKYCLDLYKDVAELCEFAYAKFLQVGLAPEQARMLLAQAKGTDNA